MLSTSATNSAAALYAMRAQVAETHAPAQAEDPVRRQLDALRQDKHVLVFAGFSRHYKEPETLQAQLGALLDAAVARHGAQKLLVVAGATEGGIGAVYPLARAREIAVAGIVSAQAQGQGWTSPHCPEQAIVYVPTEGGSWEVRNADGQSYMVDIATGGGEFIALGGGMVTLSELKEARERGVETRVFAEFEPAAPPPEGDPTPVRSYWQTLAR